MRRLALALLLAGCGEAVPVYLTETEPGPTDEAIDLLDEAFAFWGADYYLTDETGHGVLSIALVEIDDSEEHRGYTERDGDCGRRMWVDRDPVVLRHELGHAWNLRGHSDDPEHLMSVQGGDGETVTDEQWDTAQDTIDRFIRCWQ